MIEPLRLKRMELVVIPSLNGAGVDGDQPLWNGITAHEYFPAINDSAGYLLTLEKGADSASEVPSVENELVSAMAVLAAAWPFSGGSFLAMEEPIQAKLQPGKSNADNVTAQLLANHGLTQVTATSHFPMEVIATYSHPPLVAAAKIARAMHASPPLSELMTYHQTAWMEYYFHRRGYASSWYANLYNVRDFLQKRFGGEKNALSTLGFSLTKWKKLGQAVNNGYRHATGIGTPPKLTGAEVDELFSIARQLVIAYLKHEDLL